MIDTTIDGGWLFNLNKEVRSPRGRKLGSFALIAVIVVLIVNLRRCTRILPPANRVFGKGVEQPSPFDL